MLFLTLALDGGEDRPKVI